MKPRIFLCPGWVTSKTDGQDHYINADALAKLYGVPLNTCFQEDAATRATRHDVRLYPSFHGDYTLPPEAAKILARSKK